MSLKQKDLEAFETELTRIIDHAVKERQAVRLLLDGFKLRNPDEDSTNMPQKAKNSGSVSSAIENEVNRMENEWFNVRDIMEKLINSRFRDPKDKEKLRPTVSTALKKLSQKGILERRNEGTDTKISYEYKKRANIKFH